MNTEEAICQIKIIRDMAKDHPAFDEQAFNKCDFEEIAKLGGDESDWTMIAIHAEHALAALGWR